MGRALPSLTSLAAGLIALVTVHSGVLLIMRFHRSVPPLLTAIAVGNAQGSAEKCSAASNVSLAWHAPSKYFVNDLSTVINGTGVYGFIFNSSQAPLNTYNWCNMPHTNPATYPRAGSEYHLEYVEVIHRHHKRTPYAANTFPKEGYAWYCSDEGLFYGGKPINPYGNDSSATYWDVYTSTSNPFPPQGFNGTCQFPQITRGGLDDSHQHGVDLKRVYSDMLHFIPAGYDADVVSYRVTNNVITSQVASMVIAGMYPERKNKDTPLLVQPASIDSLEPVYSCPSASNLFSSYGSGSSSPAWQDHLHDAASLYSWLDAISGVSSTASDWHVSFDHYFDNLSARLCHAKPLPCSLSNASACVSPADADEVFRLGEYEYSFIYRDSPQSLPASVASYGVWAAELTRNLRHAMGQAPSSAASDAAPQTVRYRHNVAHDGSLSRLLAILQLDRMVWPGMGAEVVFELYRRSGCYFLRVLWGGQILRSSHPDLGSIDMLPVGTFLNYIDGLAGVGAAKVPELCESS